MQGNRQYDVIVTFSDSRTYWLGAYVAYQFQSAITAAKHDLQVLLATLPETVDIKNEPYELQAISCDASSAKQYPSFMETFSREGDGWPNFETEMEEQE